jgi:hypothetical protein
MESHDAGFPPFPHSLEIPWVFPHSHGLDDWIYVFSGPLNWNHRHRKGLVTDVSVHNVTHVPVHSPLSEVCRPCLARSAGRSGWALRTGTSLLRNSLSANRSRIDHSQIGFVVSSPEGRLRGVSVRFPSGYLWKNFSTPIQNDDGFYRVRSHPPKGAHKMIRYRRFFI